MKTIEPQVFVSDIPGRESIFVSRECLAGQWLQGHPTQPVVLGTNLTDAA